MDILIRYVFKHRATGIIETKVFSISQLEEQPAKNLTPCFDETEYELIARNLCADEEKGIFVDDLILVTNFRRDYVAVVKFGEFEQDGSGGEYTPSKCVGFYAEALHPNVTDKFGLRIVYEFYVQRSLNDLDSYQRIGNIYQNPELLKTEGE
ncbi:hypothetical protein V2J31_15815 [Bacillus safensis]|uniref:hypothetical protein n=1 Tax=Bacillus safensis TaxID=561879 RepID=UPI0022AB1BB9|nr:hypothetical protein [Bacillus safensis]MCZ2740281.1 hypothetical protein [Bacillus safensis]MEE3679077.1 hypothetical protein [Bacillus safensis]